MTGPPPPTELAVRAVDLRKRYGDLEAVAGVDFEVERGTCFGFLGPNGAGKTTTMRMIYCASPVDGGSLAVMGLEVPGGKHDRAVKRRIGVVPQEDNLDQDLTLRENLEVFSRFYGLQPRRVRPRVDELLALVGLSDKADERVLALSGGMKRRALIARGLIGDPELLVLDEPTTGLDPQARQGLWEIVGALRRRRTTTLLTTHYMEEAERLCDRLVIMDGGRIVARGTPAGLIEAHVTPHVVEVWVDASAIEGRAAALVAAAERWTHAADRLLLYCRDGEALIARAARDLPDRRSLLRRANLEDVFLRITGHGLGSGGQGR